MKIIFIILAFLSICAAAAKAQTYTYCPNSLPCTVTAPWTFTNSLNASGQNSILAYNLSGRLFVDGSEYTTLAQAFTDGCPSTGCFIDMTGNPTALTLGSFDPGATPVTLLLGPYTYSVHNIKLESYFNIVGTGPGLIPNGTVLQSDSTTVDVFDIGTGNGPGADNVAVSGIRVLCGAGNTNQIAFNMVAAANGGGIGYSSFKNIAVGFLNTNNCLKRQFRVQRKCWRFASSHQPVYLHGTG